MRKLAIATACLLALTASAEAAKRDRGPMIPFEDERATLRGDRAALHFHDDMLDVPSKRIAAFPRVNNVIGDRAILSDGVSLYFPYGSILSSSFEISRYRPRDDVSPAAVLIAAQLEPDPLYEGLVARLDSELGPVCARVEHVRGPETAAEMRINRDGAISLVYDMPGRYDRLTGETSRSYGVVTALSPAYLDEGGQAERLYQACRAKGKRAAAR